MGAFPPTPGFADAVFAAWLKRRSDPAPDAFNALAQAHPEHSAELHALHERWLRLEPILRLAGLDPTAPASFAERLRAAHGSKVDPAISLDSPTSDIGKASSDLLNRLARKSKGSRYRLEGEVARGGMGAILRVWDEDIRRHLAMKVVLGKGEAASDGGSPAVEPSQLARFLEEAQVTGQLDHPCIVPVHELGIDQDGRVFFTMKLVKGRDLKSIYDLVFEGKEGWNETRALSVLLKVCEAVAYAHKKGVIHRDLKPSNVMVGDYGEVYVMDWGLARVVGRKDPHNIRIAPEAESQKSVRTERRSDREDSPDSPFMTMDGVVVGTPSYMSLEQARGDLDIVDARTDVYAIGAMLYHLLSGRAPYTNKGERLSHRTVHARLLDGPPKALRSAKTSVAAELEAICEKAMSREPSGRYVDTLELAEDLRAYLEGRVVHAHEAGAFAEMRKWIRRNRALAAAGATALIAVVLGLAGVAWVQAGRNRDLARANEEIRGLSDMKLLQELRAEAENLWPALPARVPALEHWLERAESVVAREPIHAGVLNRAREPGHPVLSESESRWFEAAMSDLMAAIGTFRGSPDAPGLISDVRARLDVARTLEERTVTGARESALWRTAIEAVRASPRYAGLALSPRTGLLPLGADPASGLQEFAHVASGPPAERGIDGALRFADDTGIVLVLIPGGTFVMGAVNDPSSPAHDPLAKPAEGPPLEVALDAFYIAKHEMTQAQWTRIAHQNPSNYQLDTRTPPRLGPRNPVERISWDEARTMLARLDLELPTEAQWEYAARGGTTTSWWTGSTIDTLAGAGNLADATSRREGPEQWPHNDSLDDGALVHAPVGSYRANPFGLHDVIGNVAEWCQDLFLLGEGWTAPTPGTGARDAGGGSLLRVSRGGAFASKPEHSRSAHRSAISPSQRLHDTGVRPAAPLH